MTTTVPRSVDLRPRPRTARPDFVLIGCMAILTTLGLMMIYSASAPALEFAGGSGTSQMLRQAIFVGLGVIVAVTASLLSDRTWQALAPLIYGLVLLFLLAVLSPVGALRQGAQRWISLGLFDLQPSEIAKPAVVMSLAVLLAPVQENRMRWIRVAKALALVAVPAVLIFAQPDLGTMLVFGFVMIVMLFVGGTSLRQIALILLIAIVGLFAAIELDVLQEYQLSRLTGFLSPTEQTLTVNYNQNQSQIAIGAGGLTGQGLFQGSQTNLSFVPSQTTDFVFTAVGEQLGFLGAIIVIGIYSLMIWRMLMIAAAARDRFAQLTAAGVAAMFGFHVFVNIGMTVGLLPVVGLPLPFMSFGGSFYLSMALSVGVVNSIWMRRTRLPGDRALGT
jgi:rod shape determining protein RodA